MWQWCWSKCLYKYWFISGTKVRFLAFHFLFGLSWKSKAPDYHPTDLKDHMFTLEAVVRDAARLFRLAEAAHWTIWRLSTPWDAWRLDRAKTAFQHHNEHARLKSKYGLRSLEKTTECFCPCLADRSSLTDNFGIFIVGGDWKHLKSCILVEL